MRDGEPWFVAADVCKALEIANNRDALTRIDDDEKGVALADTLGGKQEVTIVNEPGLYSLVLGSRKPEAKVFKRWVTSEILPLCGGIAIPVCWELDKNFRREVKYGRQIADHKY